MEPAGVSGGSDPGFMAAGNTSGFGCRYAVAAGPLQWPVHACGLAIDVNTVQNPYLEPGSGVQPPAGAAYLDRCDIRLEMAYPGGHRGLGVQLRGVGMGREPGGFPRATSISRSTAGRGRRGPRRMARSAQYRGQW